LFYYFTYRVERHRFSRNWLIAQGIIAWNRVTHISFTSRIFYLKLFIMWQTLKSVQGKEP